VNKLRALFVCLLASASFACCSEPAPSRIGQCQADMRYPLGDLYDRYSSGVHPAILDYSIRMDKKMGGGGRYVLSQALSVLMLADQSAKMPTREFFVESALEICKMEPKDLPRPKPDKQIDNWGRDGNDNI
jgi:hypothetical protein